MDSLFRFVYDEDSISPFIVFYIVYHIQLKFFDHLLWNLHKGDILYDKRLNNVKRFRSLCESELHKRAHSFQRSH